MSTLELKELSHPAGEVIKIAAGKTLDLKTQGSVTMPTGSVIQVVNFQTGDLVTGSTNCGSTDDTIPTSSEGVEMMTLAITPTSATSKLLIHVTADLNFGSSTFYQSMLFQDSTTNAIASRLMYNSTAGGSNSVDFDHYMTAGTTSATTFKFRSGALSGTSSLNGVGANRKLGGTAASSITIMEIQG